MGQYRNQYDGFTDLGSAFVIVPITITLGVNDNIPFSETGGSSNPNLGVIAPGVYATGAALAAAVQTALNANADFATFAISFNSGTHKLTMTRAAPTFTLDWATRPTHSAAAALGWNATDVAATLSTTAQNAITL